MCLYVYINTCNTGSFPFYPFMIILVRAKPYVGIARTRSSPQHLNSVLYASLTRTRDNKSERDGHFAQQLIYNVRHVSGARSGVKLSSPVP